LLATLRSEVGKEYATYEEIPYNAEEMDSNAEGSLVMEKISSCHLEKKNGKIIFKRHSTNLKIFGSALTPMVLLD